MEASVGAQALREGGIGVSSSSSSVAGIPDRQPLLPIGTSTQHLPMIPVQDAKASAKTAQRRDIPSEARAAKKARTLRKATSCLGEADIGVPAEIHASMNAMTLVGEIPVTTLTRRQAPNASTAARNAPQTFQKAFDYFYIHPALPPPDSHTWNRVVKLQ